MTYIYTYKDPRDMGYILVSLTAEEHDFLFPERKRSWNAKYEFYVRENEAELHVHPSLLFKIALVALFPVIFLLEGLANGMELAAGVKRILFSKKYGAFVVDNFYRKKNDDFWLEVEGIMIGRGYW